MDDMKVIVKFPDETKEFFNLKTANVSTEQNGKGYLLKFLFKTKTVNLEFGTKQKLNQAFNEVLNANGDNFAIISPEKKYVIEIGESNVKN